MKILYGVAGEGMGHAIRAVPIITHLARNHDVTIIASSKAYRFLEAKFPQIQEVTGFHIKYKNNGVAEFATVLSHVPKIPAFLKNIHTLFRNSPDVVISDFEFISYCIGKIKRIPIISVDNIHILTHARFSVPPLQREWIGKVVVYSRTPCCNEYVIPTVFSALPKKKNVTLVEPLLRPELMIRGKKHQKNHLLVYQTSKSYHQQLLRVMTEFPEEKFIIYGICGQDTSHVKHMPYSEDQFFEDLVTCKGIICNGGFSLLAEGIALHKPILSIPVQRHYEQKVNAFKLQEEFRGMTAPSFTPAVLREFLAFIPQMKKSQNKTSYPTLLSVLDDLLAKYSKHL